MSRQFSMVVVLLAVTASVLPAQEDTAQMSWLPDRPWEVIDIAIALDTSGTMNPLFEAARLNLWQMVDDLSQLEPAPTLRVALLSYGNPRNDPASGWVKIETDFTGDLDLISERLSSLISSGDTEYVARAVWIALEGLSWTPSEDAVKLLFVVGNEKADQDPEVDLDEVSLLARDQGIAVQPIFCGEAEHPDSQTWRAISEHFDGQLAVIDLKSEALQLETPYDQELAELGEAINDTYIPLGEKGRGRQKGVREQDADARDFGSAAVARRTVAKGSPLYSGSWDLVDVVNRGQVQLDQVEESDLPEAMQAMSSEERVRYLEDMQIQREDLRQQISEAAAARRRFIAENAPNQGGAQSASAANAQSTSLDAVIRKSILQQATQKGFELPEDD